MEREREKKRVREERKRERERERRREWERVKEKKIEWERVCVCVRERGSKKRSGRERNGDLIWMREKTANGKKWKRQSFGKKMKRIRNKGKQKTVWQPLISNHIHCNRRAGHRIRRRAHGTLFPTANFLFSHPLFPWARGRPTCYLSTDSSTTTEVIVS